MHKKEKKIGFDIIKVTENNNTVFGYGLISKINGDNYVDLDNDHIPENVLFEAAKEYMQNSRQAHLMHSGKRVGSVIFAWPEVQEISDATDTSVKMSGLKIGMEVRDDSAMKRVTSGELKSFSMGGFIEFEEEPTNDPNKPNIAKSMQLNEFSLVDYPAQEPANIEIRKRKKGDPKMTIEELEKQVKELTEAKEAAEKEVKELKEAAEKGEADESKAEKEKKETKGADASGESESDAKASKSGESAEDNTEVKKALEESAKLREEIEEMKLEKRCREDFGDAAYDIDTLKSVVKAGDSIENKEHREAFFENLKKASTKNGTAPVGTESAKTATDSGSKFEELVDKYASDNKVTKHEALKAVMEKEPQLAREAFVQ